MTRKKVTVDVEASVVDVKGLTLIDRVVDYLTEREWSFSVNPEKELVSFALRLRDGVVKVFVEVSEDVGWSRILVYCIYSTFVPEPRRPVIAEALARINFATVFGNFELDFHDGELRTSTVLVSDGLIGEPMIDRAITKSLDLADHYQAALLAIAFGNASPKDVLEMASQGEGETLQ